MNLTALPAFSDNYIWMFHVGEKAVVVDPGDAAPVQAMLAARRLVLAGILVTHHHADHVGGVDALRPVLQGPVWGPAHERIPQPYVPVAGGDRIEVLGLPFDVIDVPGHTLGHIAFHCAAFGDDDPVLFCGDTLFSAGCGRLFEGTAAQMSTSLGRLAALPPATRVCCGHEYTLANLRFAAAVEPANEAVAQHTAWCDSQRAAGLPTLPSTLARELQINPFLRCAEPTVVRSARTRGGSMSALTRGASMSAHPPGASGSDPAAVLASLREWKNDFR